MVTRQLQVERRGGKVRRPETDVLPPSHAANYGVLAEESVDWFSNSVSAHSSIRNVTTVNVQMSSAGHRHYPSYHTVVDNYDYMERFVDPSFSAHVSLTQLTADIVLQMSSSARLPLDVRELADTLEMEYDSLQQDGMDQFSHLLGTSVCVTHLYLFSCW